MRMHAGRVQLLPLAAIAGQALAPSVAAQLAACRSLTGGTEARLGKPQKPAEGLSRPA